MPYELVVVGASLGGVHALGALLGGLPDDFPAPLAIVQHRSKETDGTLQAVLQRMSALPVCEVVDKQPLNGRCAYVAPADYHLLIDRGSFALSTEGPVLYARPSIDVLFESAADTYGASVVGVILTGASADGAHGLAMIKAAGGLALVQDPTTAECRVMPEAAIAHTGVDRVLPLDDIAPTLMRLCQITPRGGA